MTLYSELRDDVSELLSDPDLKTGDVIIRRVTGTTPGPNRWDPPTQIVSLIRLDAVVFTQEAEFSAGTLVTERGDEITAAGWATVIEEAGVTVNRRVPLEVYDSDEVLVDGDVRRVIRAIRTPAAGPHASVWSIRVAD